jgi:tetratricopeptide (TPR) repeat protein
MMRWVTAMFEAGQALVTGDPDRAEELATAALTIGVESGQPDAYADYETQLITARLQQGRLNELIPLVQDSVKRNPGLPMLQATLAIGHLQNGDRESALRLLDLAFESGFELLPFDLLWLLGVGTYAQVAVELQAEKPALRLYELLRPHVDQIPYIGSGSLEPVSLHLGALASLFSRYEEADAYFAKSMDLCARGRMHYAEARTRVEWGIMLFARGETSDADRARSLLNRAHSIAASHGYRIVEKGATTAIAKLG